MSDLFYPLYVVVSSFLAIIINVVFLYIVVLFTLRRINFPLKAVLVFIFYNTYVILTQEYFYEILNFLVFNFKSVMTFLVVFLLMFAICLNIVPYFSKNADGDLK